jgi:long-chain acyl-CoA synthetase
VDNICVSGGTFSNHLVAIVTPNKKSIYELAEKLGKKDLQLEKLCEDKDICAEVYFSLVRAGSAANLSKKEIPLKVKLVPDEWSADNDTLTAAMKLKRKNVEFKYKKEIETMFNT